MDKLRKMCLGILVLWLILLCGCAEAGGGASAGSSHESDAASGPLGSEELPLEDYKALCGEFEEDIYQAISLETCVKGRTVVGGPAPERVKEQIAAVRAAIQEE